MSRNAMLAVAVVAVVVVGAKTAAASSNRYLATGGGASLDRYLHLGVQVEGGQRLGDTLVFARGQLSSGMSGEAGDGGHGSFRQARAGLEARECVASEWLCGFTGLDFGYARERLMVPYSETGYVNVTGVSAVPRIGFDGGSRVRIRIALELPIYQATTVGGGASFGIGYKF